MDTQKKTLITPSQFVESFKNHFSQLDKFVGIFYSGIDPETSTYWCPDTRQADPFMDKFVVPKCKELGIEYAFVDCLDKPTFRDPGFILRQKEYNIEKVPTVVFYKKVSS